MANYGIHFHLCKCGEVYPCGNKIRHNCPRDGSRDIQTFKTWDDAQLAKSARLKGLTLKSD